MPYKELTVESIRAAQSSVDEGFAIIEKVGALKAFSDFRDSIIEASKKFHESVLAYEAEHELTSEECAYVARTHDKYRTAVIAYQGAVDSAYRFELITSSGNLAVN